MRRARQESKGAVRPATASLPPVDPELREARDPDPLVEDMVERLRGGLSGLVALDEWGRPVAWRNVVRLALGPTLERLRDAQTGVALAEAVIDVRDERAQASPFPSALEDGYAQPEPSSASSPHGDPQRVGGDSSRPGGTLAPSSFAHDRESP